MVCNRVHFLNEVFNCLHCKEFFLKHTKSHSSPSSLQIEQRTNKVALNAEKKNQVTEIEKKKEQYNERP